MITKTLNTIQKEILLGILLGDASMHYRNITKKAVRLEIKQGFKNKEYLEHLFSLFKDLTNENSTISTSSNAFYFKTLTLELLYPYYELFYKSGKKVIPLELMNNEYFTARSLAYWFMDDGHCENKAGRYKISTQCFSLEEHLKLHDILLNRFNIETTMYKKDNSYVLVIKRTSTFTFKELIGPYIISSMKYKLGTFERNNKGELIKIDLKEHIA